MYPVKVKARLSSNGVSSITSALIEAASGNNDNISKWKLKKLAKLSSQVIEYIEMYDFYVEGEEELEDAIGACSKLINYLLRGQSLPEGMKLAEAARRATDAWNSNVINMRLSNAQKLMEFINGYDCYSRSYPNAHSFDVSMNAALNKASVIYKKEVVRKMKSGRIPF